MLKGVVSIFLAESLIIPTGFITAVFLTRKLGPALYGLFALVTRLILWVEWLGSSLFTKATIKYVGEADDWHPPATTALQLTSVISLILVILLWISTPALSRLFGASSLITYLRIYAIDIPIYGFARVLSDILIGRGFFNERARVSAGRRIARLFLIIIFVELGFSVNGAIYGMIGASVAETVICLFYARPSFYAKISFPFRHFWTFGTPLFLSALCLTIIRMDILFLKALGGTDVETGYYGASQNLTILFSLVSTSMTPPLLSTLSNMLMNRKKDEAIHISLTAVRTSIMVLPVAALIAGTSHEIVGLIFGSAYFSAGPILSCLVFAALGLHILNISITLISSMERQSWALRITFPLVPIATIGYLLVIPRMGGLGAAMVSATVAWLGASVSTIAALSLWGIKFPLKTLVTSLFSALVFYFAASFWPVSGLVLLIKVAVLTALVVLCFYFLGEITRRETAIVRNMIMDRLRRRE